MKKSWRKYLALFMSVIMMVTFVSAGAIAANAETSPRLGTVHPVFYSGKVYAHNRNTGDSVLVGSASWSWGATQPAVINVPYNKYTELSGGKYTGWKFVYEGNSKDCTYMKIHDSSKTYWTRYWNEECPNQDFTASFYVDGYTSAVSLYHDRTVYNNTIYNIQMGGFKTKR